MGKLKKLVVLGALGAIVSAVAKKLQAGGNESPWQSAPEPVTPAVPTPPTPPTPPAPPAPVEAPDELLVDNAPEPIDEPDQVPPPPAPADERPDPLTDPLPEEPQG